MIWAESGVQNEPYLRHLITVLNLVINERAPLLYLYVLFFFFFFPEYTRLRSVATCFSSWGKHGGHSSGFSRGILFVTF